MISGQSLAGQVVLPEGGHLVLFEATPGELRRICQLPFSSLDRVATSTEGWVAGISGTEIPSVICWNAKTGADFALPLPSKYFPVAVTFVGQVLYVGGRTEEKNHLFLGLYDLGAQLPQWSPVQVPIEVAGGWGKSIDALLIDGLRLIVIDNLVTPCWLLVYDISEPLQPKLSTVESLKDHGTYEQVSGASVGREWIAILTNTLSGWSGAHQHITLLDKSSLQERAVISTQRCPWEQGPYDWYEVVFWDSLLFVAAGKDGIGILDLSRIDDLELDSEVCRKEFYFYSPPSFHNEKVLRIIPGRFADCLGVVLAQDSGIRSILLRHQDLLDIRSHADRVPFEAIDRRNSAPSVT